MSYRVETALSKRAGCQATECKKNGVKIDKDDLRLGIWVEYGDRGGWSWRHWGCVTGKVLQGLRDLVADPDEPGEYRWDMLDGFESGDKNSLDKKPQLQEKVRRCIMQGFIDPEDYNGDPEMNVLGAAGLHTKESKKKMRDEQKEKAQNEEVDNLKAQLASLQAEKADGGGSDVDAKMAEVQADLDKHLAAQTPATGKKRAKNEDEAEEGTPAKKKRVTKKKAKAEDDEDEDEDVKSAKPAAKSRAKNTKKEDQNGDDTEDVKQAPAKKSRAKKVVKKEEDDEDDVEEPKPAPAKKSKAKKVKKEEDTDMSGTVDDHTGIKDEDAGKASKPAPKKRAPPKKKAVKAEADEDGESAIKNEDGEDSTMPAPKKRVPAKKKAVKAEVDEDAESAVKKEEGESSVKAAPKKRAPRGKKAVKDEPTEEGAGLADVEPKPKPAAKKGRKKAVKEENAEEEGINNGTAAESSNPGITEGSSVLSDAPEIPEGMKDEPAESVAVGPEAEAADEVKDLFVPPKNRRTRSRTTSNKV